jgi:hypothetical protein
MSKGDYVYMTERERVAFDKVDPIALLYTRLLWNNLVALNYLEKESIFKSVSSYKNVVVCDSDMLSTLSNREIQSRMLSLDYEVSKIESSGAVDMLFEDEFSRWLSSEIAMVWNFKRTTVHGVDYYSQSPHLLYSVVEEPVISGMKEKIPQSPVLIEEEMPSSYQPLVETAAAADHNESRQEKKFTTSEQSIPYKMTREEFKNFILTAMDAIIAGEIPVIRIYQEDSVVVDSKSSTRVRQELQKKIDERYELLTSKINPWLKGRRGKVGSDLSLNLPVFSPQDLRVILTGNLWGEKKVPSELPGDVFRAEMDGQQKRWVVTSFNTSDTFAIDLGDDTSFPTDPSEKWKRGELLDPWASYVLCSHGYVSCTI